TVCLPATSTRIICPVQGEQQAPMDGICYAEDSAAIAACPQRTRLHSRATSIPENPEILSPRFLLLLRLGRCSSRPPYPCPAVLCSPPGATLCPPVRIPSCRFPLTATSATNNLPKRGTPSTLISSTILPGGRAKTSSGERTTAI